MTSKREARAIAEVTSGTVLAQVEIAAPRERVFAALTQGADITKWWGAPELYQTTEYTSDLRPGGRWQQRGVGSAGNAFVVEGEYLEVDPPNKVVFTWKPDWDGGAVSTVAYLLEAIDGGTRLTVHHTGLAGRPDSCRGHAEGWVRVIGWMQAHVAPAKPGYYFLRLNGPRPTFPADITERERAVMLEHAAYTRALIAEGRGVAFGPIADPRAVWGCGIVQASSDAEARAITDADPAIKAGIGVSYELWPMLGLVR